MNILISNSSGVPIYEQIVTQIKNQILSGYLESGEPLPSIRLLAKDLRISVITTKRAYEELEREGFIFTVPGKGSFVAAKNTSLIKEEQQRIAEQYLSKAVETAKASGISCETLINVLTLLYEE